MSAPETKLKEQEKRHRGPLIGLRVVVIFALVLLALFTLVVVFRANEPADSEAEPEVTDVPGTAEQIVE